MAGWAVKANDFDSRNAAAYTPVGSITATLCGLSFSIIDKHSGTMTSAAMMKGMAMVRMIKLFVLTRFRNSRWMMISILFIA